MTVPTAKAEPRTMRSSPGAEVIVHRDALSWYGSQLADPVWRLDIPAFAVAELDRYLTACEAGSAVGAEQTKALWLASHEFVGELRQRLATGPGVVVSSGLPFADWGAERSRGAIRTLAPVLGPLMEQTHDGRVLYDVRDTGRRYRPGVRRSLTNAPQPFHTDGPWIAATPEHVALFCLQPSAGGGVNRCISILALLDDLAVQDAEFHRRLGETLPWHRQGEHEPGAPPVAHHPMWWRGAEGQLFARLYTDYVHSGARVVASKLDSLAVHALDALEELATQPHRWLEFTLDKGDVLWLNNRACAHSRTGFESTGEARHLVRTWHRRRHPPALNA